MELFSDITQQQCKTAIPENGWLGSLPRGTFLTSVQAEIPQWTGWVRATEAGVRATEAGVRQGSGSWYLWNRRSEETGWGATEKELQRFVGTWIWLLNTNLGTHRVNLCGIGQMMTRAVKGTISRCSSGLRELEHRTAWTERQALRRNTEVQNKLKLRKAVGF